MQWEQDRDSVAKKAMNIVSKFSIKFKNFLQKKFECWRGNEITKANDWREKKLWQRDRSSVLDVILVLHKSEPWKF